MSDTPRTDALIADDRSRLHRLPDAAWVDLARDLERKARSARVVDFRERLKALVVACKWENHRHDRSPDLQAEMDRADAALRDEGPEVECDLEYLPSSGGASERGLCLASCTNPIRGQPDVACRLRAGHTGAHEGPDGSGFFFKDAEPGVDVQATLAKAVENERPIVEREVAAMGLRVGGVGRSANSLVPANAPARRVLEVYFTREPNDDELRAFHDYVREFRVGASAIQQQEGEQ